MPIGKRNDKSIKTKNESPNCMALQFGDSSFLFIVAKHPLGYLLPFLSLSNHLLMQWDTTPAVTATKNETTMSIKTPPPVVGYRLDNIIIISYISFPCEITLHNTKNMYKLLKNTQNALNMAFSLDKR